MNDFLKAMETLDRVIREMDEQIRKNNAVLGVENEVENEVDVYDISLPVVFLPTLNLQSHL